MNIKVKPPRHMQVRFSRKPPSLRAMLREQGGYFVPVEPASVIEIKQMTAAEYDAFTNDLGRALDWISAFTGQREQVIEVRAPARRSLYVRPEGHHYARYVGLADGEG